MFFVSCACGVQRARVYVSVCRFCVVAGMCLCVCVCRFCVEMDAKLVGGMPVLPIVKPEPVDTATTTTGQCRQVRQVSAMQARFVSKHANQPISSLSEVIRDCT